MAFRLFESNDPRVVAAEIREDYKLIYKEFISKLLPNITRTSAAFVTIDTYAQMYRDNPEQHKSVLKRSLEDLQRLLKITEHLDEKEERFVLSIEKDLRRYKALGGESERIVKTDALIATYNSIIDSLSDVLKKAVDVRKRISLMKSYLDDDQYDKFYGSVSPLGDAMKELRNIATEIGNRLKVINNSTLDLTTVTA
jgi:hypothetical protein